MAKRLRKWLQKRVRKSKIFFDSDYGINTDSGGGGDIIISELHSLGITIDPTNRYILTYFSGGTFHNGGTAPLSTDFQISFSQNGGTATNAIITSIKNISNQDLSGGESIIRINITLVGTASG